VRLGFLSLMWSRSEVCPLAPVAPSFNGRTADSGSAYRGSNPWGAANTALPRQRASMMQWWADYLDAQLAMGEESQEGANWKRAAAHTETAGTKPRGSIKPQIARHVRALTSDSGNGIGR
jgi:hypothetical protein